MNQFKNKGTNMPATRDVINAIKYSLSGNNGIIYFALDDWMENKNYQRVGLARPMAFS